MVTEDAQRDRVTALAGVYSCASDHPNLFSGAWFAGAALLLASPLGAMVLFFMALEVLGDRPVGAYVGMLLVSTALPLVSAFATGALFGPRILRLPSNRRSRAAGWGAVTALGALLLWVLLLEAMPRLSVGGQATGGGGDVPGAAAVVGYVVVLPMILGSSLLAGAAAGVLLHLFVARAGAAGDSVFRSSERGKRSG